MDDISRLTGSNAFCKSIKHMHGEAFGGRAIGPLPMTCRSLIVMENASLFLVGYTFGCAIAAAAEHDTVQKYFAKMGSKRNHSVVVAVRVMFRDLKDLNGRVVPVLVCVTRYPHADK